MLDQRLARAAGALERSVAEVDAAERFQALGRRRRRQRTVTTALALVVVAAVLGGAVVAVGIARGPDPRPQPAVVGPDRTAPARVVATFSLFGDPVAMAVRGRDLWVAGDNPTWVTRWVTPTNPMTRQTPTVALPAAPTRLAAATDAVWVLTPSDGRLVRIDPATNRVVATTAVGRAPSGLAVGAGAVWVALPGRPGSHRPGRQPADPGAGRPLLRRRAGRRPGGAVGGQPRDGTLVRVDPATGPVAARVLLPRTTNQQPHRVAVGEGAVWVTSAGARRHTANLLWRVDPVSNQVTGTLDLGPTSAGGIPNSVAAGNGAVWVGGATMGFIVHLQPS
jgi:DNA-binding beta-propeller fold protein YncE